MPTEREFAGDRAFLGHPRGLGYLAFSEGWTGFSYYGMQSLLVLYMTHELFQPGAIRSVFGIVPFQRAVEMAYGPLSPQGFASAVMGLFGGLIYAVPILGGYVGDRWLGRSPAIVLGAALMTTGHFLLTFHSTFLAALFCLLVGAGTFNANLRAQISELYVAGDPRRADAFQIYALAVNISVIVAPLICGTLGAAWGYAWGFAAAGLGMSLGLVTYLVGRPCMPPQLSRAGSNGGSQPLRTNSQDRRRVVVLFALLPVIALTFVGNQQIFNAYLLWGEANYNLVFFGRHMPVSWLLSLDALISTGALLISLIVWRWFGQRGWAPDEIVKLAIGASIAAFAPLVLAASSAQAGGQHKVGLAWGIAFHVINNLGFANIYPVGLALYARAAPRELAGTMVSAFTLSLFLASTLDGWLGGFLEKMSGAEFWAIHSALVGVSALILLVLGRGLSRTLAPLYDDVTIGSEAVPVAI